MTTNLQPWTTPADLRVRLERLWARGALLAAIVRGETLFPYTIPVKRPTAREIAERFGAVMDWAAALHEGSRAVKGFGYELRYERIRNRVQGINDVPAGAVFPTEEDALRFIGREREAHRARRLIETTLARFPVLKDWLSRRALVMLNHAAEWERILAVLEWFAANPRPNVYLRQLDIPSVDTKFIETHRALLSELLDIVLPPEAIDFEATGAGRFARRYGLREEPVLIRFRILDPAMYIRGLTDLTVPAGEFARLRLRPAGVDPAGAGGVGGPAGAEEAERPGGPGGVSGAGCSADAAHRRSAVLHAARRTADAEAPLTEPSEQRRRLRVFITENRINGLAFPSLAGSIVIFGLGYAVDQLADVPWLHDADVWYWGDIDTHGFGILNRLRARLPHVQSLLMDRQTLEAHRSLWVKEPEHRRYTGEPAHLLPDEYALFDDLRHDRLGARVRLEQERIGFAWVQDALSRLVRHRQAGH